MSDAELIDGLGEMRKWASEQGADDGFAQAALRIADLAENAVVVAREECAVIAEHFEKMLGEGKDYWSLAVAAGGPISEQIRSLISDGERLGAAQERIKKGSEGVFKDCTFTQAREDSMSSRDEEAIKAYSAVAASLEKWAANNQGGNSDYGFAAVAQRAAMMLGRHALLVRYYFGAKDNAFFLGNELARHQAALRFIKGQTRGCPSCMNAKLIDHLADCALDQKTAEARERNIEQQLADLAKKQDADVA